MNLLAKLKGTPKVPYAEIPILVRIWQEDGVWNASAFDLDVVVFGDSFEEVKTNFTEALTAHFDLLGELGLSKKTIMNLRKMAKRRGYYKERLKAQETVSVFEVPQAALCMA